MVKNSRIHRASLLLVGLAIVHAQMLHASWMRELPRATQQNQDGARAGLRLLGGLEASATPIKNIQTPYQVGFGDLPELFYSSQVRIPEAFVDKVQREKGDDMAKFLVYTAAAFQRECTPWDRLKLLLPAAGCASLGLGMFQHIMNGDKGNTFEFCGRFCLGASCLAGASLVGSKIYDAQLNSRTRIAAKNAALVIGHEDQGAICQVHDVTTQMLEEKQLGFRERRWYDFRNDVNTLAIFAEATEMKEGFCHNCQFPLPQK